MSFDENNPKYDEVQLLNPSAEKPQKKKSNTVFVLLSVILACTVGIAVFCGLYFGIPPRQNPTKAPLPESTTTSISSTTLTPAYSKTFDHAAVATDAAVCSTIGKDVLQEGGSVVDSAIASMICVGLYNAHSTGIGGGSFMTVYNATTKTAVFINSRETAPKQATVDMFKGDSEVSVLGTLAVAVPGEVAGYWRAHQMFGILPWKRLFKPSIKIAQEGMVVSKALAIAIESNEDLIHNRTFNLWPIFENDDGSIKVEGDIVRRPQLAKTFQKIADEGIECFYNGSLAGDIINDLEEGFGDNIITIQDLQDYEVEVKPALNVTVDQRTIFTPGPPASGPVMALILNILDGYDFSPDDMKDEESKILTYHRIVEAFRFAYAKRSSLGDERNNPNVTALVANMTTDWYADSLRLKINDSRTYPVEYYEPDFILPEDHGTSHLSIVGPNGDAVSMTSTINLYFGSKVRGIRTGIIFNNEMDDFSSPNITNSFGIPPSPSNFIHPGNRPMSSMCPSIAMEMNMERSDNYIRMVAGAAGGSKITTSTALTILNALSFGFDAGTSVEMKRLHDQLLPNVTSIERGFDQAIIDGLREKGHDTEITETAGSIVQAIVVNPDGTLDAACDSRKGGIPDGY